MLGIKEKLKKLIDKNSKSIYKIDKNFGYIKNLFLLFQVRNEIQKDIKKYDLQTPLVKKVNKYASITMLFLSDLMPSNLGNWSTKNPYFFTAKIEKATIELMKKYFNCKKSVGGHFTSGSTEGNIYATWVGRNYLLKKLNFTSTEKIVLLSNSLKHYSIDKAADITNIKTKELAIDEKNWNTDLNFLEKTLKKLYSNGFRGFLVPLTIGYTITGTEDNVNKICLILEKFKKENPDIEYFIWIDAAFSGISKIFIGKNFSPFKNKNVQLISTDFHKLLSIPFPSSIVLYKKKLLKLIKKDIPYINQDDSTLLGSRPGNNVVATWMTLRNTEKIKLDRTFNKAVDKKEAFLKKIAKENLNLEIINNAESIQACLVCRDKKSEKILVKKYNLKTIKYKVSFTKKEKRIKLIKLYFLPDF